MLQITKLENPIRHADWGSHSAIAHLQGRPTSERPEAELWIGDHPAAPSRVHSADGSTLLPQWIAERAEAALGPELAKTSPAGIPFLVKLLAAAQPLSIQVHPTARQAAAGFALEEAANPAIAPENRSYRDPRVKREILIALSTFHGLCGFRSNQDCQERVATSGSAIANRLLDALHPEEREHSAASLLFAIQSLPASEAAALWSEMRARADAAASEDDVAHWLGRLCDCFPDDPLVCAPLLMNIVTLSSGESLLVAPGTVHAYLEGFGIEVMTCSDNVVRAGLTARRVDLPELRRILRPEPGPPDVERGVSVEDGARTYRTDTEEFGVRIQELGESTEVFHRESAAPVTALCVSGRALLGKDVELAAGEAALIPACVDRFEARGPSQVVWVSTPAGCPVRSAGACEGA